MQRVKALVLAVAAAAAAVVVGGTVPAQATPAAGTATTVRPTTSATFVSQSGDFIGQGRTVSYTAPAAAFTVTGTTTDLVFGVSEGSDYWRAEVVAGIGDTLHPGRYYGAERADLSTGRNPGVDVSEVGRGCNVVAGSFAVNQIAFDASGAVTMADVSLVQHCERATPALTATLRYNALPLSYQVVSAAGDGVGVTGHKTYLNSTSTFSTSVPNGSSIHEIGFIVSGLGDTWDGVFSPPTGQAFVLGRTYPTAGRVPDATHAGLDISADSSGCGSPFGTLRVDHLTVSGSTVTALSITFTQRCTATGPALTATLHDLA